MYLAPLRDWWAAFSSKETFPCKIHGNSHKCLPVIEKADMVILDSWSACKALANGIPQDHNLVNSTVPH